MFGFAKRLIATTAIAAAMLAGAMPAEAQNKVINVATIGEPPTLDPVGVTADLVSIITQHIFETLYTFDGTWKLVPLLASAQPTIAADGLTYTIPLRQGVMFHNGKPMTTADVVASLDRWTKVSPRGKQAGAVITGITAKDNAVEIKLKERFAPLLPLIAMSNGAAAIVPADTIDGANPLKQFIGTGPYKLIEHKPDQFIRLAKFDAYKSPEGPASGYGGHREAKIDEIRFVPVPNASTRVEGILAGQYQFADSLPADMATRFSGQDAVKGIMVRPFGFPLMIMNSKTGVAANQTLRQAVLAALSPSDMLLAGFGNRAFFETEGSIYPKGTAFYDAASVQGYGQADEKKAADLLKKSGYKGEPIRIMTSMQYDFLYKMSLVAQANLEAAGFKVDLQVLDWATLVQRRADDKAWDAFFTFHTFVPEPSLITFMNPAYPGWWDTADKNAAMQAFNTEADPTARAKKFAEIQKLFYTEVPTIKVGEFYNLAAQSKKLTGYQPTPWPFFWNVDITN